MAVKLTFNTLLPMLYLYFRSIYLFYIIPSLSLSSRTFTGPQHYSCTFFKGIHINGSFHILENSRHDLLYWDLCPEFFLYLRVSVFPLHKFSFQFRLVGTNPCLAHLQTFIWLKIAFPSLNFTLFILLSHQLFGDRPLFKLGVFCFHFE